MVTQFLHYNDVTDRRAVSVRPTFRCSFFFYLSHWQVQVYEIELSHMGKNNGNPELMCEKIIVKKTQLALPRQDDCKTRKDIK